MAGRICTFKQKINLGTVLAGQAIGIKEVDEGKSRGRLTDDELGHIELEEETLQPLENPFGPKV